MQKIDGDAIDNLAVAIVEKTKEDYIKGSLILIKKFARPMDILEDFQPAKILIEKSSPGSKESYLRRVYWYKNAKRFVTEDPYSFFADSEEVLRTWSKEAWHIYKNKFSQKIQPL